MSLSPADQRNARLGLILCCIYTLVYLAYVLTNAFAPNLGESIVVAGLNLAVVWGFGLIGLAFILALLYGVACSAPSYTEVKPDQHNQERAQ
ncbi:MAG: DUF485 domain-containing protein [Planctomycetales bacterium]|nr:DUF485 domain-containing protein [Planctomycetales bacterium]